MTKIAVLFTGRLRERGDAETDGAAAAASAGAPQASARAHPAAAAQNTRVTGQPRLFTRYKENSNLVIHA